MLIRSTAEPNNQHNTTMQVANRPVPLLTDKIKSRFLKKIAASPTDLGCLLWTSGKDKNGYGKVTIKTRHLRSHRVAYFIATGIDPINLLVLHTCDVPSCCNPNHLFPGTNEDNMKDKARKGRCNAQSGDNHHSRRNPSRVRRGENHHTKLRPETVSRGESRPLSKLKEIDVIAIRSAYASGGVSQAALAARFNVSQSTIQSIITMKIWRHIANPRAEITILTN